MLESVLAAACALLIQTAAPAAVAAPPAPPSAPPAAAAAAQSPASGETIRDEATGLGVTPPKPFVTSRATVRGQDVAFNIVSPDNVPTAANTNGVLCAVAFKAAPANASLTQEQINAHVAAPERMATMRQGVSALMQVESERLVELSGVTGAELRARPKMGPRSDETSMYLAIFETSKGRTTMSCATRIAEEETAWPRFLAIRDTIILPR